MVYLQTKVQILLCFWRSWNGKNCKCDGHLVFLRPFGVLWAIWVNFEVIWYIFFCFGMLCEEQSGNLALLSNKSGNFMECFTSMFISVPAFLQPSTASESVCSNQLERQVVWCYHIFLPHGLVSECSLGSGYAEQAVRAGGGWGPGRGAGVARFFLVQFTNTGVKCTKWPQNIPSVHKICQHLPLQGPP
jgi:hypothetical protein